MSAPWTPRSIAPVSPAGVVYSIRFHTNVEVESRTRKAAVLAGGITTSYVPSGQAPLAPMVGAAVLYTSGDDAESRRVFDALADGIRASPGIPPLRGRRSRRAPRSGGDSGRGPH